MQESYTTSKGTILYLHEKVTKNGVTLRYFSKKAENSVPIPEGYDVVESKGLAFLKKKA